MARIRMIPDEEATGLLAKLFDTARRRAGRVFNILRIQSQNPEALRSSTNLYLDIMYGPSPLSRAQREMLAVVVSRTNDCHY